MIAQASYFGRAAVARRTNCTSALLPARAILVTALASMKLRTSGVSDVLVTSPWVPSPHMSRCSKDLGRSTNVSMSSNKRCHERGSENVGETHVDRVFGSRSAAINKTFFQ